MLIVASGPSLRVADAARAHGKARTIAVNDSWRLAPFADVLYAADATWWDFHRGVPEFAGEKWTQDKAGGVKAAKAWGLRIVRSERGRGMSVDPAFIYQGHNSGFQALNLAVLFGASRIVLLGFDCGASGGKSHWFGDHPEQLRKVSPYGLFKSAFGQAAGQIKALGIEVINCSCVTTLTCFPRRHIEDVL